MPHHPERSTTPEQASGAGPFLDNEDTSREAEVLQAAPASSFSRVTTLTDTELATRYRELVRVTDTAECGPELRDELEALATEYKERLRRRWAG